MIHSGVGVHSRSRVFGKARSVGFGAAVEALPCERGRGAGGRGDTNARGVRIWRGWPSPVDSFSVKYVVRRSVEKRDEEERGGRFEGR